MKISGIVDKIKKIASKHEHATSTKKCSSYFPEIEDYYTSGSLHYYV